MEEIFRLGAEEAERQARERRERMLADQVAPRLAWYRELWDRRAALTGALRGRIAGLQNPHAESLSPVRAVRLRPAPGIR